MPLDFRFSDIDNALRVDVSGGCNAEDLVDLLKNVGAECAGRDVHSVLAVVDMPCSLSTTQTFEITANYVDYEFTPAHRIAIVATNSQTVETLGFAKVVAANRALPLGVFETEDEALAWLEET